MRPPVRVSAKAISSALGAPEASIQISGLPQFCSSTVRVFIPRAAAAGSRETASRGAPTSITSAPAWRAMRAHPMPTKPAPETTTCCPLTTPPTVKVTCAATESGSTAAATSAFMFASTGTKYDAETRTYSDMPPLYERPITRRVWQRCVLPA